MTRLSSLQLLLPLVGDTLQPLLPLLQLPCLRSLRISSCQPSGAALSQQLAAAGSLQQLSIEVSSRHGESRSAFECAAAVARGCQLLQSPGSNKKDVLSGGAAD
jgi:hypothetical protein